MRKLKTLIIFLHSLLHRDTSSKIVFYHDIGFKNTSMGTEESIFWKHMSCLGNNRVAFDDGFRGVWDCREKFKELRIRPLLFVAVRLVGGNGYLTWDEIRALKNDYGFEIQCHTWSHQTLVGPMIAESPENVRTEEWYRHELVDSKVEIGRQLGSDVTELCFPVGYFNSELVNRCKAAGYHKVYASYPGNMSDEYVQPRNIAQDLSLFGFKCLLNGGLMVLYNRYYRRHCVPEEK